MNYTKSTCSGLVILLFLVQSSVFGFDIKQKHNKGTSNPDEKDSTNVRYNNWFNLDPAHDNKHGISTDKAYNELLKNKTSRTVIVAIIDSGVDVDHEDLKDKIWVNKREIAGNGKDDDGNGYTDDIYGWNFLGNASGENVEYENLEITRLYKKLKAKFEKTDMPAESDKEDFELYIKVKELYLKEVEKATEEKAMLAKFELNYNLADSIVKIFLDKPEYSITELVDAKYDHEAFKIAKDFLVSIYGSGFTKDSFDGLKKHINQRLSYNLNLDYNPREIIGDDPDDLRDSIYGNNDVKGLDSEHGTHVAGIIAANRNNDIGIKGVADNIKLMILRAIPNGDERDKDVANAIRYAVNNGANIINMSFGKDFSPHKEAVDEAIRYAEKRGVLIIHAAGNEADNNDLMTRFPTNHYSDNDQKAKNWITVGATSMNADKNFIGDFSNYGPRTVDVFAPGVDIYSLKPGNHYAVQSGTSMACPVATGLAALLMSYFPDLDIYQIKDIMLQSTSRYQRLKVYKPADDEKKRTKTKFQQLSVSGGVINTYEAVLLAEKFQQRKVK